MIVYRIANPKYKKQTLSGMGAEKVGGRWNNIGTRAVYTSQNISLALLEYYVHTELLSTLPKKILVAEINFPESFEIFELERLPERWNQYPYSTQTSNIFSEFAVDEDFFALKVPSAVVGIENNYILNPLYRDFNEVEVIEFHELPIDPRLMEQRI